MTTLGLDLSTFAIDAVRIAPDAVTHERVDLGRGDILERIRRIIYLMPVRDHWDDVDAIGVERPAGPSGAWQVSMAFGAVLQCLPFGAPVYWFWPASWRKLALGSGRASKSEILDFARDLWPECPTQDAADAYCVALATERGARDE